MSKPPKSKQSPKSSRRSKRPSTTEGSSRRSRKTSPESGEQKRRRKPRVQSKPRKSTIASRPPVPPKEPLLTRIQNWFDVSNEPEVIDTERRPESFHRLKIGGGLLGIGLALLMVRAGYLMLWPNPKLAQVTKQQYENTEIIRGRRGDILDRNGHLMATSVSLYDVILSPIHIPDAHLDLVVNLLQEHLGVDPIKTRTTILEKKSIDSQYLVVAREVTPLAYDGLLRGIRAIYREGDKAFRSSFRSVKSQGISSEKNTYRYYTGKSDAAPLLGGFSNHSHRGVSGIEQQYDKTLRGMEFATIRIRDRQNQSVIQLTPEEMAPQAQDGKNLALTLDRRIQHITDKAIAKAVDTAKAESGFAVVVDVETGEILASSSQPTGNINDNTIFKNGILQHHGLVDAYEAGSVLKPLVVASAMNEGLFTPDTLIDTNNGRMRVHGATIRDDHPKGIMSVTEVIKYSSNVGAAKVALELGKESTVDYLRKFGFGQETGLNFPAEPRGVLYSAERLKPINLITMSYGYGLTTTLTQLAMAYAALGNEGVLMKPLLVKEVTNSNGEVIESFEPTEQEQVVSPRVARQMLTMMETVVDDGTAKKAQVPGFRVAGKTGTAKKAAAGGYSETARIGSFIGLIPADNPKLAIAISIDTPTEGLSYGGVVAAPAFSEIAEESMKILGISPDPTLLKEIPTAEKEEIIVATAPPELIWTEKGEIIVPDLTGLTLRDALSTLQVANLNLRFQGSGRITTQVPVAGTRLLPQEDLEIVLR